MEKSSNRQVCLRCRKAESVCYCKNLEPMASQPQFVILLHPKENRKAINTGRMAHLTLSNSLLLVDADFTHNQRLNQLLQQRAGPCYVLFPGPHAIDLDALPLASAERRIRSKGEAHAEVGAGNSEIFILLDATWAMAKKMYRLSSNLHSLPQVSFIPTAPSQFHIRKQPKAHCYSTLETIHHILQRRSQDSDASQFRLMEIFLDMVRMQLDFEQMGDR